MMEQYKYEPVFGLQKPFDGGPLDATAYGLFRDGDEYIYYKIDKTAVYCFDTDNQWSRLDGAPTIPFLGMRRVIAEPKRWTAEDQRAGRLPEVGSEIAGDVTGTNNVLFSSDEFIVTLSQGGEVGKYSKKEVFDYFNPIESPEEKAARLREEWVDSAITETEKRKDTTTDEYERLKARVKDIYDALLSGDLPVPVKGE